MKHFFPLTIFLFCSFVLTAQVKTHPNGAVQIGDVSAPMHSTTTKLQVDGSGVVFNVPSVTSIWPGRPGGGFMFYPSMESISFGGGLNTMYDIAVFSGISGYKTVVGATNNNMYKIYSTSYYTNGSYLGILSSSDRELKTNIRDMGTVSGKFSKLRPVMYDFVKSSSGEDVSKNPYYQNRVGFIAQELKEIFPDVVDLGADTIYRIDYAGLIPYLTKAMQEQSATIESQDKKINELQNQLNDIRSGMLNVPEFSAPDMQSKTASANTLNTNLLYQNIPNPFNITTTIKYQLIEKISKAQICIYNLTGKQLQCYSLPITQGESTIEVKASSLQAGMYLYSLIVDDKLIDTKRMILTE